MNTHDSKLSVHLVQVWGHVCVFRCVTFYKCVYCQPATNEDTGTAGWVQEKKVLFYLQSICIVRKERVSCVCVFVQFSLLSFHRVDKCPYKDRNTYVCVCAKVCDNLLFRFLFLQDDVTYSTAVHGHSVKAKHTPVASVYACIKTG